MEHVRMHSAPSSSKLLENRTPSLQEASSPMPATKPRNALIKKTSHLSPYTQYRASPRLYSPLRVIRPSTYIATVLQYISWRQGGSNAYPTASLHMLNGQNSRKSSGSSSTAPLFLQNTCQTPKRLLALDEHLQEHHLGAADHPPDAGVATNTAAARDNGIVTSFDVATTEEAGPNRILVSHPPRDPPRDSGDSPSVFTATADHPPLVSSPPPSPNSPMRSTYIRVQKPPSSYHSLPPSSPPILPVQQPHRNTLFALLMRFFRKSNSNDASDDRSPASRRRARRWRRRWRVMKHKFAKFAFRLSRKKGKAPERDVGSVIETLPAIEIEEIDEYTVRLTIDIRPSAMESSNARTHRVSSPEKPTSPPKPVVAFGGDTQGPRSESSASHLSTAPTTSIGPSTTTLPTTIAYSTHEPLRESTIVEDGDDLFVTPDPTRVAASANDCVHSGAGATSASPDEEIDEIAEESSVDSPAPLLPRASLPNATMPEITSATTFSSSHAPPLKRSASSPSMKPSKLLGVKHSRWRGDQSLRQEMGRRIYEEGCPSIESIITYAMSAEHPWWVEYTSHILAGEPLDENGEDEQSDGDSSGWREFSDADLDRGETEEDCSDLDVDDDGDHTLTPTRVQSG
ncbi:hypothetical protein FRB99_003774 [Tulasnella sp. 403]|nr:hypothetical protein FRB99_003774 [Tulasnella sp. 403]